MKKRMDYEEKVNKMHDRHTSLLSTNLIRNETNNSMYLSAANDPNNIVRNGSTYSAIEANKSNCISNFFTQSREDEKPMKMPSCKISRGIFLAIVFFLFFCLIIVWFFVSGDLDDENYELHSNLFIAKNFFI